MAAQLDLCDIQDAATRLGVRTATDKEPISIEHPSFIIGTTNVSPMTMAASFAAFANDGVYCKPIALTSVKDAAGNKYKVPKKSCDRAISQDVAAAISVPLENLVNLRLGGIHPIGVPAAAKTGTTDKSEYTWTVGYTKGISTASWVGNPHAYKSINNIPINGVTRSYVDGATIAGGQWTDYMEKVAGLYKTGGFGSAPSSMLYPPQPKKVETDNKKSSDSGNSDDDGDSGGSGNDGGSDNGNGGGSDNGGGNGNRNGGND